MKHLIITDLHGRNPKGLIEQKKNFEGIERVICLGDVECPDITKYLLDLGKDFVTLVPGNHDFPYMVDCCKLEDGLEVDKSKKPDYLNCSVEEYWKAVEEWKNEDILKNYARTIVGDSNENADDKNSERFQRDFEVSDKRVVCVHASLFDEVDQYGRPDQLWARLYEPYGEGHNPHNISRIFYMMKEPQEDIWMVLRGHDVEMQLYSIDRKSPTNSDYDTPQLFRDAKTKVKLSSDKCYIASLGGYLHGQYGIFDDTELNLEFHNPGRRDFQ